MGSPKPFEGPRLKVERANHHIRDFSEFISEFIQSNFCRIGIDKDQKTGNKVLSFEVTEVLPEDLPMIIGDAVHNLRAALDHLAYTIVKLSGKEPSRNLYFPIRSTKEKLETLLDEGEISVVGTEMISYIRDIIKPYPGGNDPLWGLNQMDVIDKHKLLVPIVSVTALEHVKGRIGTNVFEECRFGVIAKGNFNVVACPENFEIDLQGQPSFNVHFGDIEVFQGQTIVPTLHQLSDLVMGIVDAIQKRFFARI